MLYILDDFWAVLFRIWFACHSILSRCVKIMSEIEVKFIMMVSSSQTTNTDMLLHLNIINIWVYNGLSQHKYQKQQQQQQ